MKTKEFIESAAKAPTDHRSRAEKAVELAAAIIEEANRAASRSERKLQRRLAMLVADSDTKNFTLSTADQCFRSSSNGRTASQLIYLLDCYGAPVFQRSLSLFKYLGRSLGSFLIPPFKSRVKKEAARVIVTGSKERLNCYLKRRYQEGFRVNLNHLGEAVHGEEEAKRRLEMYLADLKNPDVEYISVKVSTIFSQLNLISWEETLAVLTERLKLLYGAASQETFVRPDGTEAVKFVNLDMEEYRDLRLTVAAFKKALDDPDLLGHSAGIALQAYLPDSYDALKDITGWAQERLKKGGASVKVRLVKGANLAMEQVEASIRSWPQAPYTSKLEVDANFKRMLHYACEPEHAAAVRIGIGSHNIFDIAYGMLLRAEKGVEPFVEFEMLEGMADSVAKVVKKLAGDLILYCPSVADEDFDNAIAYLTRRLDENTGPDNFLRHSFELKPGNAVWQDQAERFLASLERIDQVSYRPRRQQDRTREPSRPAPTNKFENEPDTDWTLPQNRRFASEIVAKWSAKEFDAVPRIENDEQLEKALGSVKSWERVSPHERAEVLDEAAQLFRHYRGDLIGAMMAEGNKTIYQADVEVSEAIDFIDYYRRMMIELCKVEDIQWSPKGIALVTPPWNFSCSIPTGGIAAALVAGNGVLFKPAPEAVNVGYLVARIFWEAGVGSEQLQFVACDDEPYGTALVKDERVDFVVLTGGTETAKRFKEMRPGIDLIAETGGKNSLIVTALADRDLAIASAVHSAFGYSGQKCSACSLLILEAEVYDDPKFMRQLHDAAASLPVGSVWDLSTVVNPLIGEPNLRLLQGLTELEAGEEWLLEPRQVEPGLWSPGIKLGVKPGSFMHQTELFGPVIGVMRAKNLDQAIEFANGTPYGLTAGIQTLDKREQEKWLDRIVAGNCYVNRGITGAIIQRQPFGGCKESSFGPGAKAGGPNYIFQMMRARQISLPRESEEPDSEILSLFEGDLWRASMESYTFYWQHYFSLDHDPSLLVGQDNLLRYRPYDRMVLRVSSEDQLIDIMRIVAAAKICGTKLQISSESKIEGLMSVIESEETLASRVREGEVKRIRMIGNPGAVLASSPCDILTGSVLASGRLELLHYLREVSISIDYHRYGNLGDREQEKRSPLPESK